ncbi:MAG TPA: hypothetical protein V6C58_10750, partial [Allocoleopsis sp.]
MKKNKDEKKKWPIILIAGFIVFSMIISIFAIVLDNQTNSIPDYNDNSFVLTTNGYKTKINGEYKDFYYHPLDIENIKFDKYITYQLQGMSGLGIVFDPNQNISDNLIYIDVFRYDLGMELDKPTYAGILNASDKYPNTPVVNCSVATPEYPLIVINTDITISDRNTMFEVSSENPNC